MSHRPHILAQFLDVDRSQKQLDALAPLGVCELGMPMTPQRVWALIESVHAAQPVAENADV